MYLLAPVQILELSSKLHLEVINKTIYNKHIYDEIWQSDAWCLSICVQFEVMKCTWSVADCVLCESLPYVVVFLFFCFFYGLKDEDEEWWKQLGDMGSFRNTQTMMRAKRHLFLFFFLIFTTFSQSSTPPPSSSVLSHPQIPLKFQMLTIPQCPDAVLWPFTPLNPELSFITFLWSWEWKRWDKGERGGAESNMAAYLEDFLYGNMCKQFTHKGLK